MPTRGDNQFASLLMCAAQAFSAHKSQIAKDASNALTNAITQPIEKSSYTIEQCAALPQAYRQHHSELLTEIENAEKYLRWLDTGATVKAPEVQANLAFVELIGPSGMIANQRCKVGLLLQKPNAHYPNHRHAADEIYLVVSGKAKWSQSHSTPVERLPGEFIHHTSWEPHEMLTSSEPVLSLWCWTGDISFDKYEMI